MNKYETAQLNFDTDLNFVGKTIEISDLDHEDIVAAINNADCYMIVRDNGYRTYINLVNPNDGYGEDWTSDKGSFKISTDDASSNRLLFAIDNARHSIVQKPDGEYTLFYEEGGGYTLEGEIELLDEETQNFRVASVADSDECDLVWKDGQLKQIEEAESIGLNKTPESVSGEGIDFL